MFTAKRITAVRRKPKSRETVVKTFFGEKSPPFEVYTVKRVNVMNSWDIKKNPKLNPCIMPP
jgi:hypothetical protein